MLNRFRCLSAILVMGWAGCHEADLRSGNQLQLAAMDRTAAAWDAHHKLMTANATLYDMSLADIHFVPHSTELSGTGMARLDQMGRLLDTYGGTIRYTTDNQDEGFVRGRIQHVEEYLQVTGVRMEKVAVKVGLPGGRGMSADHAVEVTNRAMLPPDSADSNDQVPSIPALMGQQRQ